MAEELFKGAAILADLGNDILHRQIGEQTVGCSVTCNFMSLIVFSDFVGFHMILILQKTAVQIPGAFHVVPVQNFEETEIVGKTVIETEGHRFLPSGRVEKKHCHGNCFRFDLI